LGGSGRFRIIIRGNGKYGPVLGRKCSSTLELGEGGGKKSGIKKGLSSAKKVMIEIWMW